MCQCKSWKKVYIKNMLNTFKDGVCYLSYSEYVKYVDPVSPNMMMSDINLYQWTRLSDNVHTELLLALVTIILGPFCVVLWSNLKHL